MIKAIFFDADGTLIIPKFEYPKGRIICGFPLSEWTNFTEYTENPYKDCHRNIKLHELMVKAKSQDIKMGVLSLAFTENERVSKTNFITKYYQHIDAPIIPADEIIYFKNDGEKIDHLKYFAKANGYSHSEIMYIDDAHQVASYACQQGFEGHHISEFLELDFCEDILNRIMEQS